VPDDDEKLDALIRDLPDEKGARLFSARLAQENSRVFRSLLKQPGLLSDLLALVAWSPLLGTTLEQSPAYISWLDRERLNSRVRTPEDLRESLARFALTNSSLNSQVLLARFRRRELLRIYLHDLRRTHTIVETTEELSNLADAILDYALSLARQDLDNRYGPPQFIDQRGRVATAEFCIVALGKLGSYELNYASDIDLLFLYSDDGRTSGAGERGEITNREYFVKLAAAVTRLVGQPTGEGAAYRVDLRLRPFGRDGALASSLDEAVRYYHERARQWELQALIRARPAAGWPALYSRFAQRVRGHVFRSEVSVPDALASVRIAKQNIDEHESGKSPGFNVKLGRGGIREIEFIAQALQLAHAGRDPWLRVPHTLIILGRLADRDLISEQERSELSDAYAFLRRVEHRVQMEHGLQTHKVPTEPPARELLARRMNFGGAEALAAFDNALQSHTENVRSAYERIFGNGRASLKSESVTTIDEPSRMRALDSASAEIVDAAAAHTAATVFAAHSGQPLTAQTIGAFTRLVEQGARKSLDRHRALLLVARIASSLDKSAAPIEVNEENLYLLLQLCGSSEFFGEMIAGNPDLIASLAGNGRVPRDYRMTLRSSVDAERNFAAELSALRSAWSGLLLEIACADSAGEISLGESNRLQTELAIASINAAFLIARREMARRFGNLAGGPRLAILGLGRLASGGVDYGSDLDIVLIYDSAVKSPVASLTQDEAYARLGEMIISALSGITRTGHLYHVDLRLRPDGNDGPLVSSSQGFLDYLTQRAVVWEWLAYVKLRAVAGDLELGRNIEAAARRIIHEGALKISREELQGATRHMRDRLQQETVKPGSRRSLDIKHGLGGMLDIYFVTRYLQLRDNVPDAGANRSTLATLARLESVGSLDSADCQLLSNGYGVLRAVDHEQRLLKGRSGRLPPVDHPTMRDIAKKLNYNSAAELSTVVVTWMQRIREAYDRLTHE